MMAKFREILESVFHIVESSVEKRDFVDWLMVFFQSEKNEILKDEEQTRGQSQNEDWFRLRHSCITSSKASEFLNVCTSLSMPVENEQFNLASKLRMRFHHILEEYEPTPRKQKPIYNCQFGLDNEKQVQMLLNCIVSPWLFKAGYITIDYIESEIGFLKAPGTNFIGASLDSMEEEGKSIFEIKCFMNMFVDNLSSLIDIPVVKSLLQPHIHPRSEILNKTYKFYSSRKDCKRKHSAFKSYLNSGRDSKAILFDFLNQDGEDMKIKSVTEYEAGELVCHPYHKYSIQVAIQSYVIDNLHDRPIGTTKGYICVPIFSRERTYSVKFADHCEMILKPTQFPIRALLLVPVALTPHYVEDLVSGIKRNFSLLYFAAICDAMVVEKKCNDLLEARRKLSRVFTSPLVYLQPINVSKYWKK